jgi:lysyl-tRNA synthetase class 2
VATEAEILEARRRRAEELRARGEELFPARVPRPLDRVPDVRARFDAKSADELAALGARARVAGRLLALRSFGRFRFATLASEGAELQLWVQQGSLGAERYARFELYEIGDIVWAQGALVRTKKGELSLDVADFGLLAKAYRPLPEKWHGLVDVETRYRQRHVDLIVNPEVRAMAIARGRTLAALRQVLDERGFLEVETPVLQQVYGGGYAQPFATHHNAYGEDLFLRISLELYLKRLLVGGLDRVYELGRNFRNEGVDRTHNPEFTMLEAYQAYADYTDMMELAEALVTRAAQHVRGALELEYQGRRIDLAPPWPRRTMTELIRAACGIDIGTADTLPRLRDAVRDARIPDVDPRAAPTWAKLVDAVMGAVVEPDLVHPTFVVGYPVALSPLAKRSPEDPRFVERFEAFIGGMEIVNAFTELNDPDDQRARFAEQAEQRRAGDADVPPIDEDFLRALEQGMPPAGGLGLGFGRLVMLLTGASHLREVKLFPHMRKSP